LLPGLTVALRLGIILRIPFEFLFPELHKALQVRIREEEEDLQNAKKEVPRHHSRPAT